MRGDLDSILCPFAEKRGSEGQHEMPQDRQSEAGGRRPRELICETLIWAKVPSRALLGHQLSKDVQSQLAPHLDAPRGEEKEAEGGCKGRKQKGESKAEGPGTGVGEMPGIAHR